MIVERKIIALRFDNIPAKQRAILFKSTEVPVGTKQTSNSPVYLAWSLVACYSSLPRENICVAHKKYL